MKEIYAPLEMEIIVFEANDVIISSDLYEGEGVQTT